MHGWHEMYNDLRGPDVVCGHLIMIAEPAAPADPPDACPDCLREGTTWIELRRCLVCGRTGCCDASPRRHAEGHYRQQGHPVIANQSGGDPWGWCYVDQLALAPGDL
jgi:CPA1 family monovalent cation:H+ antiporter